jgi:hypothetical protein
MHRVQFAELVLGELLPVLPFVVQNARDRSPKRFARVRIGAADRFEEALDQRAHRRLAKHHLELLGCGDEVILQLRLCSICKRRQTIEGGVEALKKLAIC